MLEAMGAGSVVLAHDNPFNREVLGESEVFWRDVHGLVERFAAFEQAGEEELERLRRANVQRIRDAYCWDRLADEYADLIVSDSGPGVDLGKG